MRLRRSVAVVVLAASALIGVAGAEARSDPPGLPSIVASDLPKDARLTLERIRDHGPFPYERDGIAFGNREGILPPKPRGYYHEYTVRTPGTKGRGARRIICGGEKGTIADCYYSDDHYQSFRSIRP
jgi:ribonuclease T1